MHNQSQVVSFLELRYSEVLFAPIARLNLSRLVLQKYDSCLTTWRTIRTHEGTRPNLEKRLRETSGSVLLSLLGALCRLKCTTIPRRRPALLLSDVLRLPQTAIVIGSMMIIFKCLGVMMR